MDTQRVRLRLVTWMCSRRDGKRVGVKECVSAPPQTANRPLPMVRGRTLSVHGESEVTSPAARVTAKVTGVMPPPSWSDTRESADCEAANRPMATSSPMAPSVRRCCSRWSADEGAASNNDDPGDNDQDAAVAAASEVVGEADAAAAASAASVTTPDSPTSAKAKEAAAMVE